MKVTEMYLVSKNEFKEYNIKFNKEFTLFLNDFEMKLGVDYTLSQEDNVITITFNEEVPKGNVIKIEYDDTFDEYDKVYSKNPYDKKSMFSVFTSEQKLRYNHTYSNIDYINDDMFENKYIVEYSPFYTDIKKIRSDTGELLDEVGDEVIARIIYEYSKEAIEKNENEEFEAPVPTYVKNFVRYKTDIDLCNSIYLSISGKAGSKSKSINDISVETSIKIPFLEDLLKRFKELLKLNEDAFSKDGSIAISFVKAKQYPYPIENSRLF